MGVYKKYGNVASRTIYKDGTTTPDDYTDFRAAAQHFRDTHIRAWWLELVDMDPLVRFRRNINSLMGCVITHPVSTVIPAGVTDRELKMLDALGHLSVCCRAVGHELLNLRERQLFMDRFRPMLNAYRCKGGNKNGEA